MSYVEKILEELQLIPNFNKELIENYLHQAEKQFNATLQYSFCSDGRTKGLILKYNDKDYHIGAVFCGKTQKDMQINMLHHFINWHYGKISNDKFIANLGYENSYQLPIFG